ncbi:guanylyltransferase [Iodobacter sp. HSC-16F04]|uniref:tRNA(His) guanylyltransferase n=1 Tax=Iodobacter violaceini TaxID=3044271 RepID=A0ABX0KN12_9NEIS|nr:tRNA(His) guanylyltransferase Thg1 family protein [Iodobacter violacea]NHQ85041.1 guanylyltransferase [Iodobacter violacea]
MKFNDLEQLMRPYETISDYSVAADIYMVARIDGRSFTTLTKETGLFEIPFDIKFRDLMIETTKHLMNCGFKVIYAYTESDEISLLFDLNISAFNRKLRKYNSILAGEASAKFTLLSQTLAAFDCRISQLPSKQLVVDYFRWRNEDAHRNALNAHCYWILRKEGLSKSKSNSLIESKSSEEKKNILLNRGIDFENLPLWQKRGVGLYWDQEEIKGYNPIKNTETISNRTVIKTELELASHEEYSKFMDRLLTQ